MPCIFKAKTQEGYIIKVLGELLQHIIKTGCFVLDKHDPKINKDLCYVPNLSDAINFAYKKTIGPIEISNLSIDKNNSIKNYCFLIKEIIQTLYIKNNNISIYKNEIISICDNIYKEIK